MKSLIASALFIIAISVFAHADSQNEEPKIEVFEVPMTENAAKLLKAFVVKHLNTNKNPFEEFYRMQGVMFPKGSSCSLDLKRNLLIVKNEYYNASLIVMITGDVASQVFRNAPEPEMIKRYLHQDDDDGF